jgi:Uma2 family endonuclease
MTAHVRPGHGTPDGLLPHTFDADDVRRMVEVGILHEDQRVELVEGELVAMASKGFAHDWVKNNVIRTLARALSDEFYLAVESTLRLSRSVLLEPDLLVALKSDVLKSPEGFATVDGPRILLAIEVAASSLAYDRGRKAALYARFGVPEYWVIDANERIAWVHTGPSDDGYGSTVAVARGGVLRPAAPDLSGVTIDLAALA